MLKMKKTQTKQLIVIKTTTKYSYMQVYAHSHTW